MSARRRCSLCSVYLLLTAASFGLFLAAAAGAPRSALDERADPRLAQPASLSVEGKPLYEALKTIEKQTGVSLEAGRDVADLKVMLHARTLLLRRSLAEVADLLELTWSRRGSAPGYRYLCSRSLAAAQRARAAVEQARTANRAAVAGQLTRIVAAIRSGNLSALNATDPQLAAALDDPTTGGQSRAVLQYLGELSPARQQELLQTGQITTSYDRMAPAAKEKLRQQTSFFLPLILGGIHMPDGNSPSYDAVLQSAQYSLGVSGLDYGGNTYHAGMEIAGYSLGFSVNLGSPNPAGSTSPAAAAARPATGGPAAVIQGTPASVELPAAAPRPALPRLSATLEGGKSRSVREIVDWLAEKTPFAIVSDYYVTRYERLEVPMPVRAGVEAVLEALDRSAGLEATLSADQRVVRLRNRRWPLDDLMEPPPGVVEALTQAIKTDGRLGLSEYLLAGPLTEGQSAGLARIDAAKFGRIAGALDGSNPLLGGSLRLTASLTPAQRAAAEARDGLPVAELSPAQRDAFALALTRERPDLTREALGAARFSIRRDEHPIPSLPGLPLPSGTGGARAVEIYTFSVQVPGRPWMPAALILDPLSSRPAAAH